MELYKVHPLTQALGAATSGSARTAVVSTSAVWRAHCQRIFCMCAVSTASCHESSACVAVCRALNFIKFKDVALNFIKFKDVAALERVNRDL